MVSEGIIQKDAKKPSKKRSASHASPNSGGQNGHVKRIKGEKNSSKGSLNGNTSSTLSRKERKELSKQRKARGNKNFALIEEVVVLWETLRRHDIEAEERKKLVSKVLKKIDQRIAELSGNHSASRVVQACIKYGSTEDRQKILKEVQPRLLELSKSPYGHFVVSKLIDVSPKNELPAFVKAFKGHVAEMLRHPAATHVLDDLYCAATSVQRNSLAAECYGREYALFEGGTLNNLEGPPSKLKDLLDNVQPSKRREVLTYLASVVMPVMEKGLVDSQLSHRLIAEYIENAPASLVVDAIETLSGDSVLHMLHTRYGSRAACSIVGYGSAKERKKIIRSLKGHVDAAVRDEWGHLPVIMALSVVDDTTLLKKTIVKSLSDDIEELATHRYAHRIYLNLLHPDSNRYVPPAIREVLTLPEKKITSSVTKNKKGKDDEEGEDDEEESSSSDEETEKLSVEQTSEILGLSKKDNFLRRKEILQGSLGKALIELCSKSNKALFSESAHGADLLMEVIFGGGPDGVLSEAVGENSIHQVQDILIGVLKEDISSTEDDNYILSSYFGSRALRRALLALPPQSSSASQALPLSARFVNKLWEDVVRGHLKQLINTHAAKVLAAILHSPATSGTIQREFKEEARRSKAVKNLKEWESSFLKSHNSK